MDWASFLGIISGIGLLGWAIIGGESAAAFWHPPSLAITIGGTLAATLINYPLARVVAVFRILKNAFFGEMTPPHEVIEELVKLAEKARREGLLALEEQADAMEDPFMRKGLQLVVDGTDPELVRSIMETELSFLVDRHKAGSSIFQTMGAMAPAFGMMGTLIGLIQMLRNLDNPEAIGPGLATALVTTFYGTLFANLFCNPVAGKLKIRSAEEVLLKEVVLEGLLSIQAGDNPRIVREKLQAFLAPTLRERREGGEISAPASASSRSI